MGVSIDVMTSRWWPERSFANLDGQQPWMRYIQTLKNHNTYYNMYDMVPSKGEPTTLAWLMLTIMDG